jgi:hypothetical protein
MKLQLRGLVPVVAGAVLIPAGAQAFLIEQNANDFGSGRTIGLDQGFAVFSPFDVTAGWHVTSIGVDGFEVIGGNSGGFNGDLYVDDGTGNFADETTSLVTVFFDFNGPSGQSNWTDAAVDMDLAVGRYWLKLHTDDPTHWSANYFSDTGLTNGYSTDNTGAIYPAGGATALRIDGEAVPETATVLAVVAGLGLLVARRRK